MQPKKENKFDKIFLIFVMLAVTYLSMVLSLAARPGRTIITWYEEFNNVILPAYENSAYGFKSPLWFKPYLNEYTSQFILYGFIAGLLGCLMYISSRRNYIAGKEFGTSNFIQARKLSKILAEPDDEAKMYKEVLPGKRKVHSINTSNRRLSQNLYMSMDTEFTDLNNNICVVGGPGSGKSFRFVIPLIFSMVGSYIITDCKGELRRKTGKFLEKHGYIVKSINFINRKGMRRSARFNPFRYIRNEIDVVKTATSMLKNTKDKESVGVDPFWENAQSLLIQALIYYIIECEPKEKQNFRRFMELLNMAEFEIDPQTGAKKESKLDMLFNALEERENKRIEREKRQKKDKPKGMSLAVTCYNKCMTGAADTVRSIIISLNARLVNLQNDDILDLLEEDELNFAEIGMGHNYDGKTKTAIFLEIPDNDDSYNFVIGMLYTLLFQELYYWADNVCEGGELPIHVTAIWDEFANVALPENVADLMSTMRGRNISAIPIIQMVTQLKDLFKEGYEKIVGNCDTFIYLGSNEPSAHELVSKLLGKGTYDKRTTGENLGVHGSSNRNYDVVGRELMLPDEVRKMNRKKCLVIIAGYDPVIDFKIKTQKMWQFYYYLNPAYEFDRSKCKYLGSKGNIAFATPRQYQIMEIQEKYSDTKKVFSINADALMNISSESIDAYAASSWLTELEEDLLVANEKREEERAEKRREHITDDELTSMSSDKIKAVLRLRQLGYNDGQIRIMLKILSIDNKVLLDELISMFGTEMDTTRMNILAGSIINQNENTEEDKHEEI